MKPETKILAEQLVKDLRNARIRAENRIWYRGPIIGEKMCAGYKKIHDWELTTVDIRAAVHYARTELKQFIGSNSRGYFYCLYPEEWDCTIKHLKSRIKNIAEPYRDVIKLRKIQLEEINQTQIQRHPVMDRLIGELDLVAE